MNEYKWCFLNSLLHTCQVAANFIFMHLFVGLGAPSGIEKDMKI